MFAFFTIALLHFLALVSPGPDFAIVVKNSILYQKKTAIYTALGLSSGIVVHVSYCLLGFAIVIAKSLIIFNILKYLGATYLIYIGVKSLLAKQETVAAQTSINATDITPLQAIRQGFFCNALNPKASLFFLGLFTLVIKPDTHIYVEILYGAWMVLATFLWFAFIASIITHQRVRSRIAHLQYIVSRIMGVCLIGFALRLIFLEHH